LISCVSQFQVRRYLSETERHCEEHQCGSTQQDITTSDTLLEEQRDLVLIRSSVLTIGTLRVRHKTQKEGIFHSSKFNKLYVRMHYT